MKKTVLAFAVAAAMGVPAVAAADTTLYGRINMSVDRVDNDVNSSTQMASNSSRFGIRGSEDLGGGLRGTFQIETGNVPVDNGSGGLGGNLRNSFLGLAGDFGEVRLGRHDTPYKLSTLRLNFFADTLGDMHNLAGTAGESNAATSFYTRANNAILYISPNFEGIQVMAQYSFDQRATGDRPATGANDQDAYSLSATYTNGPIFVAAAYERWNEWNNAAAADSAPAVNPEKASPRAWKIGGAYTIDDLTIAALYEKVDTKDIAGSRDMFHIGARYNIGQTYLMASYSKVDDMGNSTDTGADMIAIGGGYNFSRRTGMYATYAVVDNDNNTRGYGFAGTGKGKPVAAGKDGADVSGFQIGVWHNF